MRPLPLLLAAGLLGACSAMDKPAPVAVAVDTTPALPPGEGYLVRPQGRTWFKVSLAAVLTELVGVLVVGAISLFDPVAFPHDTVWSQFGRGYGFVPLLLPVAGLWWLVRHPAVADVR